MPNSKRPWWQGACIYQIYPRSFFDSNNDGIGDLKGIESKLEYVASLGVDAVWLSPFFKSPMKDFGYDVSNYREVDPLFGDMQDLKALLAKAKKVRLKVMFDLVLSHTSDQHAWFIESRADKTNPKHDWYVWQDANLDGSPPNNWLSVFGGSAWQWEPRRGQYYLHNFLREQPDLNFWNEQVRQQVLDEVRFWCDIGVDGFRFDVVNYFFHDKMLRDNPAYPQGLSAVGTPDANPYKMQRHQYDKSQPQVREFLERVRSVTDCYEDVFLMAEIHCDRSLETIKDYTSEAKPFHSAYSFDYFDKQFSPEMFQELTLDFLRDVPSGSASWAFSNHDVCRVVSRWFPNDDENSKRAKCLLGILCALPGQILIYQGEELGLCEAQIPPEKMQDPYGVEFYPEFCGRDGCRTPIPWDAHGGFSADQDKSSSPWLPIAKEHLPLNIAAQNSDPDSVLNIFRLLIEWRHAVVGVARQPAISQSGKCVIFEYDMGRGVFNFGDTEFFWEPEAGEHIAVACGFVDGRIADFGFVLTSRSLNGTLA